MRLLLAVWCRTCLHSLTGGRFYQVHSLGACRLCGWLALDAVLMLDIATSTCAYSRKRSLSTQDCAEHTSPYLLLQTQLRRVGSPWVCNGRSFACKVHRFHVNPASNYFKSANHLSRRSLNSGALYHFKSARHVKREGLVHTVAPSLVRCQGVDHQISHLVHVPSQHRLMMSRLASSQ